MPSGARPGDGRISPAIAAAAALHHARLIERIASGKKWCPGCKSWLELADFSPAPSSPDGRHCSCRPCCNAYARARYATARGLRTQIAAALRNWRPPPDPPACCTGTWDGTWQHDQACPFGRTRR
jgi:hypothetical protein